MGKEGVSDVEVSQIDALLKVAKKHRYRVGSVHVGPSGVTLEGLVPLAPDVEETDLVERDADRRRQAEKAGEDRRLLNL